nr:PEP-CTERM sorting domain-containing protein [Nitrosospira sp. Nsp1]
MPEPESYAMLPAGLESMGAMVRRRGNNRNTWISVNLRNQSSKDKGYPSLLREAFLC